MQRCHKAVLAVPGDLATLTGGYHYDRRLLAGLRALGCNVATLRLADSFPLPTAADMRDAGERLAAVPPDSPIIIDGLAMGAMDHRALAAVRAPLVALVHHPLAAEEGLDASLRARFLKSERDNLALAAHVLVTSEHTAELLSAKYAVAPERVSVARPGTEQPRAPRKPADPPLILSVGIQIPRKGHDVLLRALHSIATQPWQAVIVGAPRDAACAHRLAAMLTELDLRDRVRFAGEAGAAELAQLYGQATLFALATRYEGYGMVFDEAMAHGLPMVSCRVGAVPATVASGAGELVPADDPKAFAAAMARILNDDGLRSAMAAAAAAAGAKLPDWSTTAGRVADVLDQVLADV